ncbi:MAG: alpha/beta hydrolase family protein [Pseudomonas sp.]
MFRHHRLRICLCVLAIACTDLGASEAEPVPEAPAVPAERPALPSRSESMATELARQLPSTEVLSLQSSDGSFMALWRPANVAESKGLVILLPGEGESADWPRGIGPLRRGLPDHGWHTLSVSLPDSPGLLPPVTTEPEREPSTEEDGPSGTPAADNDPPATPNEAGYLPEEAAAVPDEPASEAGQADPDQAASTEPEERPQLAERIDERIDAALAHARTLQPRLIVLLGQGTGGYWAARHLQQLAPEDVRHLLLIQPRQPEGQEEPLAQLVPALKLATGDFFYQNGPATRAEARARLNASRRIQHPAYHQVGLPALIDDRESEQQQLLRRVRGWLDKQP